MKFSEPKPYTRSPAIEERNMEILQAFREGKSAEELAEKYHLTASTVRCLPCRYGYTMKDLRKKDENRNQSHKTTD